MAKSRNLQRQGTAGGAVDSQSGGGGSFVARFESQQVTYDSILPPADELERLEILQPGAIQWYMRLAEAEAKDRRMRQARVLELQSRQLWFNGIGSLAGLVFAGTIGLVAVGGGIYAMANGLVTDFAGAGTALGGLAALVGVYVYGKRSARGQDARPES